MLIRLIIIQLFICSFSWARSFIPTEFSEDFVGEIQTVLNSRDVRFSTMRPDVQVGDLMVVVSPSNPRESLAYFRISRLDTKLSLTIGIATVLKSLDNLLIKPGDWLLKVDLSSSNPALQAHNQLLLRDDGRGETVSSRYRPLFTQGIGIGETAETLDPNEIYVTWYGQVGYGLFKRLTLSSNMFLNALGGSNAQIKTKVWSSATNTTAFGLTYTRVPRENKTTLNLDFMWDSISNSTTTTHTFITLAVASFDQSQETSAIRSFGTSAFQTGYEFLLSDWTRVLVGPSFNFEKKAVGGYVSWVKIWDRFHLHLSLGSTDISSFKPSFEDGYYAFFDAYWRY